MAKTVDSHQIDLIGNFVKEAEKIANSQTKMAAGAKSAGVDMKGAFGGAQTAVKSLGSEFLAMAGWVGVAATVAKAVAGIVTATADAETQAVKLETALKRTGESADVPRINAWAAALQQATGISDEAAVSLVALGSTMGLSTDQSREFVQMANDMALTTGTLESNFDALARAADGDSRALAGIARQFNIIVTEGTPAAEVFEKIKAATDGAAAAQLDTLAGQWKLFKENIGNAAEWNALGAAIQGVLGLVNRYASEKRITSGSVAGLSREDLEFERARLQSEMDELALQGNSSWDLGTKTQYMKNLERIVELSKELGRLNREEVGGVTVTDKGGVAGVYGPTVDQNELDKQAEDRAKATAKAEAEATKAAAEAERQRIAALETSAKNGAAAVAEEQQARLDTLQIMKDQEAREKAITAATKERVTWEQALDDLGTNIGNDTDEAGQARIDRETEEFLNTAELDGLIQATEEAEREVTDRKVMLANLEIDWSNAEKAAQQRAHDAAMAATAQMKEDFTILAEGIAQLAAGDYAGAAGSITTSLFGSQAGQVVGTVASSSSVEQAAASGVGAALGGSIGGAFGAVIGSSIGQSLGSLVGLGGGVTETEASRDSFHGLAEDAFGYLGEALEEGLNSWQISGNAPAEMRDLFQSWAELASGQELEEWGADMTAGLIDAQNAAMGYSMTLGEQADFIGSLVASSQNLTQAEADMLTASTALFSSVELTAAEVNDLVNLYASGLSWTNRYTEAQERLTEAIQDAAATADGTSARDKANAEVESARADYIALMAEDAANKEKWEQAVKEQTDVDDAGFAKMLDGVDGTNAWLEAIYNQGLPTEHDGQFPAYHSGKFAPAGEHMAWVRNDELISPPEKFGEAAAYLASRGYYADSGGSTRTIILQVDGKEMSRVVDKHTNTMSTRTREVAR